MIPVPKVRKPRGFDTTVKTPGAAWLEAHPNARRPKDLWTAYRHVLETGFEGLCGYAAMLDPTGGTVDHYLSWKNHRHLAYEWSNFRFASDSMNKSKGTWDEAILDPYDVGPGWFEIILPSLQLQVTDRVPAALREKAIFTINKLKLRDGEKVVRWRRYWYALYQQGRLDIDGLEEVAPLIAEAVRKKEATERAS
jgi:hypothetical protein